MSFSNFPLSPEIKSALANLKFKEPFPIQIEGIPVILEGKDILGIAKTGSGKTATYVLPILHLLKLQPSRKTRMVSALILVPTRELCAQVQNFVHEVSTFLMPPVKSLAVFGGVSINPQMKALFGVEILVATPGRLLELVDVKAVDLSQVKMLVLDEADKLLNPGFKVELSKILALLPNKRQTCLFSATLTSEVLALQSVVLREPVTIKIESEPEQEVQINQTAYLISDEKKGPFLRELINKNGMNQVLVFASSSQKADKICDKLVKNGFDAKAIHGKKSQGARTSALKDFKDGKLRVLVTSDLLSRGIDIEFLPFVINYELPRSPKEFIHRIGRTGRANAVGEAITFVTEEDKHHFQVIQKKMGTWLTLIPV